MLRLCFNMQGEIIMFTTFCDRNILNCLKLQKYIYFLNILFRSYYIQGFYVCQCCLDCIAPIISDAILLCFYQSWLLSYTQEG